jgi:hypothetical protein
LETAQKTGSKIARKLIVNAIEIINQLLIPVTPAPILFQDQRLYSLQKTGATHSQALASNR